MVFLKFQNNQICWIWICIWEELWKCRHTLQAQAQKSKRTQDMPKPDRPRTAIAATYRRPGKYFDDVQFSDKTRSRFCLEFISLGCLGHQPQKGGLSVDSYNVLMFYMASTFGALVDLKLVCSNWLEACNVVLFPILSRLRTRILVGALHFPQFQTWEYLRFPNLAWNPLWFEDIASSLSWLKKQSP